MHQNVGQLLVHVELFHEQGPQPRELFLAFLLRLFLGHDVQFPTAELAGKSHVLAATANSLRQVVLIDHDIHAVLFFVNRDPADLSRRERIDHELRSLG